MPTPFVPLKLPQFRQMLASFPFTRTITTVHMHHTFRPNHSQYRGLASIESMHRFHTQERGFSDIAQHITIAPDGTIWTGRNWNKAPASASGHNGNAHAGPFMFEMIGDFDHGRDVFEDPQRNVVLEVIAAVQQRFGLPPDALKFHNQMSPKSCPGTAISFEEIVAAVRQLHAAPRSAAAPGTDAPFPGSFQDDQLTGSERALVNDAIEVFLRDHSPAESLSSAEPPEGEDAVLFTGRGSVASSAARGVEVTADDLIALRPHVINLSEGQLKEGGDYFTLPQDVERIFSEDMEKAFADPESVGMPRRGDGHPFRCIVWAHGGLISERDGLAIARKHLDFWKANGIYPIYFAWETGLGESLGFMLRSLVPGGSRGARNFFSDNVSDPMIEGLARAVHAGKIWTSMKRNAELAHSGNGGAIKVASELKAFCGRHAGAIEIHAAGHSAGSIFHSHFLPAALDLGIPAVSSLYLLAPAIRVDHFKERLLGRIGTGIKRLGVFTMLREHEMDDHCAKVYRKSLLYLIRFSLEKERGAEILGLEESLRRDRDISRLLGLNNSGTSAAGDIVFSKSPGSDGQFASQATSHGGFDDDAPTMNSIALRILGEQTKASLKAPYPESSTRSASDPWVARELEEVQRSFGAAFAPPASPQSWSTTSNSPAANLPGGAPAVAPASSQNGRRLALCVGIDRYRVRPLAGCVADARLWERTLQGLGFQSELLVDEDATYANIKARVERLVRSACAGDVIVWQYAGHGTQVPDVNGDEGGGDSPGKDEAICPVDMHTGRMFTDDEIAALIQELQPGVSFTLLMDCCHS
ncbi:caspase family protein, partial [Streptococcus pyogenes]|uniref:caspase family protein n=1 Tax=Streptococcus pyogenes TaxID=1314 RepID=UPI003DA022C1